MLSIDMDYFLDAPRALRDGFPQLQDYDNAVRVQAAWQTAYAHTPGLAAVGLIPAFDALARVLAHAAPQRVCFAAHHTDAYLFAADALAAAPGPLELVNVDFHHDMYAYRRRPGEINCGNWAACLLQQYPERLRCLWVPREDSDRRVLGGGDAPVHGILSLDEALALPITHLFFCTSPMWVPPHLLPRADALRARLAGL
jgi:hypothetical protein